MVALIKKDLILSYGNKQSFSLLLLYPVIIFIFISMDNPSVLIFASIVTFSYMLSIMSFAYEGTFNTRLLIDSLPIKRWEVIVSKYIFVLINYVFSVIFTYIYAWILELFGLNIIDYFNFFAIKNTFLFSLFSLGIALPLLYALPPKIARFLYIFIYIVLTNIFVLDGTISILEVIPYPILLVSLYLISMGVSILIYSKRDLR